MCVCACVCVLACSLKSAAYESMCICMLVLMHVYIKATVKLGLPELSACWRDWERLPPKNRRLTNATCSAFSKTSSKI